MTNEYSVAVLVTDKVNENHRLYPHATIEQAIKKFKERKTPLYVTFDIPSNVFDVRLEEVCGTVQDMKLENGNVVATVSTFYPVDLQKYSFIANGIGNVDEHEEGHSHINDYEFTSVAIIEKFKSSWDNILQGKFK